MDPNSNAETFATNPDNSDAGKSKTLAWRNAWDMPELTKETKAALLETDADKRAAMYQEICRRSSSTTARSSSSSSRRKWPAMRKNLKGFKLGPSFDTNFVEPISKE